MGAVDPDLSAGPNPNILKAFKKLTSKTVVWVKRRSRLRETQVFTGSTPTGRCICSAFDAIKPDELARTFQPGLLRLTLLGPNLLRGQRKRSLDWRPFRCPRVGAGEVAAGPPGISHQPSRRCS